MAFLSIILLFPINVLAADPGPRLEGIALTEGSAKSIEIQVWALGNQVREHPVWQFQPVFAGSAAPNKPFAVDLGEARLPVQVELAAEGHVGLSLRVAIPEQLTLPSAWLREGETLRLRVRGSESGGEPPVVWGWFWADGWGWDGRRWKAAIPHVAVPKSGTLQIEAPAVARAVWIAGVDSSGAFGTVRHRGQIAGGSVTLKIDSASIPVRVWDERSKPAAGVELLESSSPFQVGTITDEEGRASVQVPIGEEWTIIATDTDSVGQKTGRGRPAEEVDLDLGPLEHVEIRWPKELGTAVLTAGSRSGFSASPRVVSGGRAALPKLPSISTVEYWGADIAPGRIWVPDTSASLPLKAQASVMVDGRVVSGADHPVAGLPVWLRISASANASYRSQGSRRAASLERPWLPWAVTDSAGRFSIAGLPAAEYEVEVRAPGLPVARSERLEGKPGEVLQTTVTLRAGAPLDLRVTDPDGEPLAGVTVDLYRSDTGQRRSARTVYMGRGGRPGDPEVSGSTNDEGRARLEAVPVGTVLLRLSRPGSVSRTIADVEVPPEGVDMGDHVLQPGVSLAGTTVGPDGESVGEAEVALERNAQVPVFRAATTSDEDGRFVIPDLEPSGEVYLQARAEGLVPEAPLKVEMPPDGEVEVEMAEERVLEGRVLDARDDSPLEGAAVLLTLQKDTGMPGSQVYGQFSMTVGSSKTDASGRFLFKELSAGEFEMSVSADGKRGATRKVMVGETDPEPIVIRLEEGFLLRGRVETSDGDAADAVLVVARPASHAVDGGSVSYSNTQTDADGRFFFDDLGPGTHSVLARAENGQNAEATAEAGQGDEVVLRFPRGAEISGTVFDPDGSPLNGAAVNGFNREPYQRSGDVTGPDGRYVLPDAAPGRWEIRASAEGLASDFKETEVREGEPVSLDFRLERGATVIGEIRGLVESELESCSVYTDGGGQARPSADGTFRIEGVPSGERQVIAFEMTTRRSRSVAVVVPESGEAEPVVIDFASGLAVFGRVLRGGSGAPGLPVSVVGMAAAGSGETISGPEGAWRVEGLEPGEYQLSVQSRSGEVIAGDHVLLEGDTEIDLHIPVGFLSGRVLEADTQQPLQGAAVTVTGAAVPVVQRTATSDPAGAFEVSELADGDYSVRAEATGRAPAQEGVTLSDGVARELTLLLEPETSTVFIVREADGRPASGIQIQSLSGGIPGPFIVASCTTGGRCAIDDLPRGRWTVSVRGQGKALLNVDIPQNEVEVQLRKTGELTIKAPADESGAAWQVRVSDAATGIVLPVHRYANPAGGEWVPVQASGLRLSVPEGSWRIESFAPDGTTSVRDVVVAGGGEVRVELE